MKAKRIIILLFLIYAVASFFLKPNENTDIYGRMVVGVGYLVTALSLVIFIIGKGSGFNFKNPLMLNLDFRIDVLRIFGIMSGIFMFIGIVLEFLYNYYGLSYMYDFISFLVVLMLILQTFNFVLDKKTMDYNKKKKV